MDKLHIDSIRKVKKLRYQDAEYSSIQIDVSKFNGQILKVILVWSVFRLKLDGELIIVNVKKTGYGFDKKTLNYWQVQSLIRSLSFDNLTFDIFKNGQVKYIKTHPLKDPNGITFAVVSSNSKDEVNKLYEVIYSIKKNIELSDIKYEILICLSEFDESLKFELELLDFNIRVISHDCFKYGQVFICEKKALLWEEAAHDLLVVSHTRIVFDNDFIEQLVKQPVYAAAPSVMIENDLPYLDYVISKNIDSSSYRQSPPYLGSVLKKNYLELLNKKYEPYIDGGVILFDKRKIRFNPFQIIEDIPWGEAEDLALARILISKGILVDYLYEAHCISLTSKFSYSHGNKLKLQLLKQRIKHWLVRV